MKNNLKAYIAWLLICIIWGTTYLAIKIGVTDLPPMLFAGLRWLIAGSFFLIILKLKREKLPGKEDIKRIAVVGICLLGIGNGFVVVGEQFIPSGIAALLITTLPFVVLIIEKFFPGGWNVNKYNLTGLILGLLGVLIIVWKDLTLRENSFDTIIGTLSLLTAVISWGYGSVYAKNNKITVSPIMSASFQMLIAGSLQVLLGLILGEASRFVFTEQSLFAFLYLVIIASMLGYGSYMYAINHLPISFVTTYTYVNPVIALILGWIVLNEKLDSKILISSVIILTGIYLVRKGSLLKK